MGYFNPARSLCSVLHVKMEESFLLAGLNLKS
jgi:hypothetical protein